jgi:uncharacterized protein (DUF1501 family)
MSVKKSTKRKISRRKFIGTTGCAAMGSTAFLSSFTSLGMMNSLTTPSRPDDYRALVCILLAGGNDSYNMVVPTSSEPYDVYSASRSNLALPSGDLIPLNYTDPDGIHYGLHPAMPEVANLFNSGNAAVISNVGTLVEPVTKTQILAGTAPLPLGLKSHSDQSRHWQTSVPQSRMANGWGAKVADILASGNTNQNLSMNLSVVGTNFWQAGNKIDEFTLSNQHDVVTAAIDTLTPLTTEFADTDISNQMKRVAQSIAVSGNLGMERQTYYVKLGGFDTHEELLNNHNNLLSLLSGAIGSFYKAMDELGTAEKVTTFTISDFARTITSNGSGTDHAWGGHSLVFGGAVNGRHIFGKVPSLDLQGDRVVDKNVVIPEISTDSYFAELAMWMGVPTSSLADIFPNLENFYTPGTDNPIGFMNMSSQDLTTQHKTLDFTSLSEHS